MWSKQSHLELAPAALCHDLSYFETAVNRNWWLYYFFPDIEAAPGLACLFHP